MAKAGKKSTTSWVLLSEAKARAFEAYTKTVGPGHADEFAERHILDRLQSGQTSWRCRHAEGSDQYLVGFPEFFCSKPTDREAQSDARIPYLRVHYLTIDWTNSSAHRPRIKVYQIEIAINDLALPATDPDDCTLAKVWVPREARNLKRAGKLDGIKNRTQMAKLLIAVGVEEKGLPEIGEAYIRDNLVEWESWPISEIKI